MFKDNPQQKRNFTLTLIIALAAFILLALPNAAASENLAMIRMFEPDEAAPLPSVLNMIAPAGGITQALRNFIFYQYYFYGFPYFAVSAVMLLPLRILGQLGNYPVIMLVLRQMVSVLPMLIGLLILVYLQDGFRTYRSPILFTFLLFVPAVLANNLWWHVDGLVFLLIMLVIYFLRKDNLRFDKHFLIAAALIGCATAAKLVGLYFFLAIAILLAIGWLEEKVPLKKLILMALLFLLVMGLAYLISNPFLVSYWAREEYKMTFEKQMGWLSEGYGVVYEKGPDAAWPVIHQYYGQQIFLLVTLYMLIWGAIKSRDKLLHTIILAWIIPVMISVVYFTHFKFQYGLPALLPLISSLVLLLPEKLEFKSYSANNIKLFLRFAMILVVVAQLVLNVRTAIPTYTQCLQRAEDNATIAFYDEALAELGDLAEQPLKVYYDYRLYMPETNGWTLETSYDLLSYDYIQRNEYDLLFLQRQRIQDYLDPEAIGIDEGDFVNAQVFYEDALGESLEGYELIFSNEVGLVFTKE